MLAEHDSTSHETPETYRTGKREYRAFSQILPERTELRILQCGLPPQAIAGASLVTLNRLSNSVTLTMPRR